MYYICVNTVFEVIIILHIMKNIVTALGSELVADTMVMSVYTSVLKKINKFNNSGETTIRE